MTTAYDPNENEQTETADASHLPPEADYPARATSWAWDAAKDTGEVYLVLGMTFEHGGHDWNARAVLFFGEKADKNGKPTWQKSLEILQAMGLEGRDLSVIGENVGPIGEGTVDAAIIHDHYRDRATGEPRVALKAKWLNVPRSKNVRASNAPDAGRLGGFFAQMTSRVRAMDAASRASGTQPAQPARQPVQQPAQGARTAPTQARVAQSSNGPQRAAQAPQRGNQPPPRVHGQGGDEFGDDAPPF